MSHLQTRPAQGIPDVAATPAEFQATARLLAAGTGPFAIDTERASSFKYDDRAFLLQIRRAGAGTVLIDPEGGRADLTHHLAPVLNGQDWIIHAASSDLPCLAWLGLYPGTIFDTELASRMAGFEHPNLSTMTEQLVGVELEKGYGDANWAARPIPTEQLAYAALDVEWLLELAEALSDILAETDKLDWAYEEFSAIVQSHADITAPPRTTWEDLKGISTLRSPEQCNLARALWNKRDEIARRKDLAPGKILPNKVIIEIARALPRSEAALGKLKGFPRRRKGASRMWFQIVAQALHSDPAQWPRRNAPARAVPGKSTLSHDYPQLWETYQAIREDIDFLADELHMQPDTIIRTADVRYVLWGVLGPADARHNSHLAGSLQRPADVQDALLGQGVRQWQADLIAPILLRHLFPEQP